MNFSKTHLMQALLCKSLKQTLKLADKLKERLWSMLDTDGEAPIDPALCLLAFDVLDRIYDEVLTLETGAKHGVIQLTFDFSAAKVTSENKVFNDCVAWYRHEIVRRRALKMIANLDRCPTPDKPIGDQADDEKPKRKDREAKEKEIEERLTKASRDWFRNDLPSTAPETPEEWGSPGSLRIETPDGGFADFVFLPGYNPESQTYRVNVEVPGGELFELAVLSPAEPPSDWAASWLARWYSQRSGREAS